MISYEKIYDILCRSLFQVNKFNSKRIPPSIIDSLYYIYNKDFTNYAYYLYDISDCSRILIIYGETNFDTIKDTIMCDEKQVLVIFSHNLRKNNNIPLFASLCALASCIIEFENPVGGGSITRLYDNSYKKVVKIAPHVLATRIMYNNFPAELQENSCLTNRQYEMATGNISLETLLDRYAILSKEDSK